MAVQRTFHGTDANTGMTRFMVRIVEKGDDYGRWNRAEQKMALTHEKDEPLVEFYDADSNGHPFDAQFISRYYFTTLSKDVNRTGIDLCGYEPAWQVSGEDYDMVMGFLREYEGLKGPVKERAPLDFSRHL